MKPTNRTNKRPLTYGLRPSVQYHRLGKGKAVLVLNYPLRTVFIPEVWQSVADCLASGAKASMERITAAAPHMSPEQIELFLNTLVRKGYVAQDGFPQLASADHPTVTVIVPVRNRPGEISTCLKSLSRLDYPADKLEIIVVDDASDDATPDVVAQFNGVRLLCMDQHRQASFCRNRAAEIASGDILAFIDSDCLADPTWLKELVPAFRDPSLAALGGRVDGAYDKTGIDGYEKVKSALKMGPWFKRSEQAERFFYVPACNLLVRSKAFTRLGGFRESMHVGEDVDICWRIQDAGYALEYRPLGRVLHKHRNRIGAFCARRFDYGTSEPALQHLHAGRVKTLYLPMTESLFWLTVLLSVLIGSVLPLFISAGLLIANGAGKHRKLKSCKVQVGLHRVYLSTIRGYLSFVYHGCSFISRYYLIAAPIILPMSPLLAAWMAGMHLFAGVVEYIVRKPQLNLLSFLFYFTLEQVSYQIGVWWACFQWANFKPVLPRIIHTRVGS